MTNLKWQRVICDLCDNYFTKQTLSENDFTCQKCKKAKWQLRKMYNLDKYDLERIIEKSDVDKYFWQSIRKCNNILKCKDEWKFCFYNIFLLLEK